MEQGAQNQTLFRTLFHTLFRPQTLDITMFFIVVEQQNKKK